MIERPNYINKEIFGLLTNALGSKLTEEDIADRLSWHLLNTIHVFKKPELLFGIISDIDGLEYVFTDESVNAIRSEQDNIPVKILIDHKIELVPIDKIKESFEQGCTVDCMTDEE